jgi:hypothetical protein
MKNYCGSFKHMRAVDGKQNLQFHWPYELRIKKTENAQTVSTGVSYKGQDTQNEI